jgi:hypothetical protein
MGDPERLLGPASGSDDFERELLGSLRDVSPPPGAKHQAWEGVAVQIAAIGVLGAVTATEAAAGTSAMAAHGATAGSTAAAGGGLAAAPTALGVTAKVFTAKVLIGVALGGSTLAAGSWWATHRSVDRAAIPAKIDLHAAPAPEVPAVEPPAEAPMADPCESSSSPPCPTVALPSAPDHVAKSADTPRRRYLLGLESRLLTQARAELRRGDARAAMSTLERLQTRFPNGILMQEREVLTIEVLAASGDTAAASRKAREFLRAYPNSPHAAQLHRFTGEP